MLQAFWGGGWFELQAGGPPGVPNLHLDDVVGLLVAPVDVRGLDARRPHVRGVERPALKPAQQLAPAPLGGNQAGAPNGTQPSYRSRIGGVFLDFAINGT